MKKRSAATNQKVESEDIFMEVKTRRTLKKAM